MPESVKRVGAVFLFSCLLVGCSSGASDAPARADRQTTPARRPTPVVVAPPAPIRWHPCAASPARRCGSVSVPVDYDRPAASTIRLSVIEQPALDPARRIGTLLFNPGGPGQSGVAFLDVLTGLLPPGIAARFDLVGFDERGTGASRRIDCGTGASAMAAAIPIPATATGPLPAARLFRRMAHACVARYGRSLGLFDSTDAARDLDRIRVALGVARIDYLGLSYGTVLGALYAERFPTHVRTMILDGAVDPTMSALQAAREQGAAFEAAFERTFRPCHAPVGCPGNVVSAQVFARVSALLGAHTLRAPGRGDDEPVTIGDLDTAAAFALTVPGFAGGFGQAVTSALHGNGAPLRAMSTTFEQDIDGSSVVDASWAYTCADIAERPSPGRMAGLARELVKSQPAIGAFAVTYDLAACAWWPPPIHPITRLHVSGAAPIVVIGTVGDPNTPVAWAGRLAAHLGSSSVLIWRGTGHTWLLNGAKDACMRRFVTSYLVQRTAPPRRAMCS